VPEPIQQVRTGGLRGRPLIGGTLSVAALTAIARLNGGVREILVAREFGTSAALEAFLVGFGLVTLIVTAVSGALPGALVPTFFRAGEPDANRASDLLSVLLPRLGLWLVGGAAAVMLGAGSIAGLIGGGFDGGTAGQLRDVLVVLAPVIPIAGVASLCTSLVNARERFVIGAIPQIFNPITTIVVIVVASEPRSTTLALAFLAGFGVEMIASAAIAAVTGVRLRLRTVGRGLRRVSATSSQSEDRRLFFAMFLPMFVAFAVQASGLVIDQAVASHLPQGQVAVLAFGSRVTSFAIGVGGTAVGTVVLPQFSRLRQSGQAASLASSLRSKVVLVAIAGSTVALVLSLGSEVILDVLFGRGRFTASDVAAAAQVQVVAAWQIPLHLVNVLYLRLLSASHRQRIILVCSLFAAVANLVLDVLFASWFGVRGIALSTTVVFFGLCLVYRRIVRSDLRHLQKRIPV